MEKHELLKEIEKNAKENSVTWQEIVNAYHAGKHLAQHPHIAHRVVARTLYYFGAFIIFCGISVLLWQHWNHIGFTVRLACTLGASIVAYVSGILFHTDRRYLSLANAFFLLSILTMPVGLYVIFDHLNYDMSSNGMQAISSGILFCVFFISYWIFRPLAFIVFNILFGTWFVISYTNYLIQGNPFFIDIDFYNYRTLFLGIMYLLFAHHFSHKYKNYFGFGLYLVGSIAVLGSALELSGWKPDQNIFWEIMLPILCFAFIAIGVLLKRRVLLVVSIIFLLVFIGKITAEYFVTSLGWPLALVSAGLLAMVLGYLSIRLHGFYHHHHQVRQE
ncbi:MAG: DUF2157 domain-containing protein [Gammaproteobacteria bacterium]